MFGKSWKRISLSLGILSLIVISGLCYLSFDSRRKSKEPVKIYRVTQPGKKSVSDPTPSPPSVQTDTESTFIQSEVSETADARIQEASVSTPSDRLGKQKADAGSPMPQQSNEALAEEKAEQEIAELEADIRRGEEMLDELLNETENSSDYSRDPEAKQHALAKELNALSSEEQRAYFEEKAAIATKIISEFHEKLRSNPGRRSEEIAQLIESMQQILPDLPAEERMKQHVENLRRYGFEPKF